jgi:hypothetical protein
MMMMMMMKIAHRKKGEEEELKVAAVMQNVVRTCLFGIDEDDEDDKSCTHKGEYLFICCNSLYR